MTMADLASAKEDSPDQDDKEQSVEEAKNAVEEKKSEEVVTQDQ